MRLKLKRQKLKIIDFTKRKVLMKPKFQSLLRALGKNHQANLLQGILHQVIEVVHLVVKNQKEVTNIKNMKKDTMITEVIGKTGKDIMIKIVMTEKGIVIGIEATKIIENMIIILTIEQVINTVAITVIVAVAMIEGTVIEVMIAGVTEGMIMTEIGMMVDLVIFFAMIQDRGGSMGNAVLVDLMKKENWILEVILASKNIDTGKKKMFLLKTKLYWIHQS